MDARMAQLSLSDDEEGEVQLLTGEGSGVPKPFQYELCLVGCFLTDKNINFPAMRDRLAALWRPYKGVKISDPWPSKYIFQFFHPLDLTRVLDGGPWTFDNHLLILHHLVEGDSPANLVLSKILIWVQIYDIPIGYMCVETGQLLGDFIGKFVEYDDKNNSSMWRSFMRIRVELDVSKPLKRCKKIRKPAGDSGVVSFKYERLPYFCFTCGLLGHTDWFCSVPFEHPERVVTQAWGAWLRATPRRSRTMGGERWLRDESDEEEQKMEAAAQEEAISGAADSVAPNQETSDSRNSKVGDKIFSRFATGRAGKAWAAGPGPDSVGGVSSSEGGLGLVIADGRKKRKGQTSRVHGATVAATDLMVEDAAIMEDLTVVSARPDAQARRAP